MKKYRLKKITQLPLLHSENNIIVDINEAFSHLTGYSKPELIGKHLIDLNKMIQIGSRFNFTNIDYEFSCFMFTKELEPREVTISSKTNECKNEKIYTFREKPYSRIEDRLQYACCVLKDNKRGIGIYSIVDEIFLKTNSMFLDFWYRRPAEIDKGINSDPEEIVEGYMGSGLEEIYQYVIKTEKSFYSKDTKYKFIKRGDTYWHISLVPIHIEGKAKFIIHTAIDLTEQVLYIDLVKKQKEELETVVENISDELVIFNENSEYTMVNKELREKAIFDVSTVKDSRSTFEQVVFYDMDGNLVQFEDMPSQKVLRGERFAGYRMVEKEGMIVNYKEFNGTPIYDSQGKFVSGVLICRDISDKLKNEESLVLKSQFDLLRNLLENLDVGIVRCSYPQLKIIDINNWICKEASKFNPKLISKFHHIGKDAFQSFPNHIIDEFMKVINILVEKKENAHVITQEIVQGQVKKYIKFIFQPLIGFNKEIVEIIITSIDITEEVNAKNMIEEALKIQDEIFANVVHELKTPLNVIFTANQLMELYVKQDLLENHKEAFIRNNKIIKQNCYRQIKLINNIVDLTNIESGHLNFNPRYENIVNTVEIIVESVSEFIKGRGLRIVFDTEIEVKMMSYDVEMIERVILNLISNAIKFSNSGGEIIVNISDKEKWVEISVQDMGIGIDIKKVDSIFERFYQVDKTLTRKSEGNGIGLSLVKSLIEIHEGNISVESEVGKGSLLKIELPVRKLEGVKDNYHISSTSNIMDMINIELSDIYSI